MAQPSGRWPPNILLSHDEICEPGDCAEGCVVQALDEQTSHLHSSGSPKGPGGWDSEGGWGFIGKGPYGQARVGDSGGASRFFPQFWWHVNPPTKRRTPTVQLIHGDCLDALKAIPDCTVDSVVTDPPYALSFMSCKWDTWESPIAYQKWCQQWATECLRVLKPGGHLLAFSGTRTYHRLVCGIEDAGFLIADKLEWLYGQGFPKSLAVDKAIDKMLGAEREVVGTKVTGNAKQATSRTGEFADGQHGGTQVVSVTAPSTDEANRWAGWGTALKPAHESIVRARKPLDGTVAATVTRWGTGALNIDGCRVAGGPPRTTHADGTKRSCTTDGWRMRPHDATPAPPGRWPPNTVLSHDASCNGECVPGCPVAELDQQSGPCGGAPGNRRAVGSMGYGNRQVTPFESHGYTDSGGASRFFPTFRYCAKPSTREKSAGLDGRNPHPTTKPVELCRWLCRLVTPPGGVVLDCFAGSGTIGVAAVLEGFAPVLIEAEAEYLPVIEGRLAWALRQSEQATLPL